MSNQPTYDVFISHSAHDKQFALEVVHAFRANELEACSAAELPMTPGSAFSNIIWQALAESRAFVILASSPDLPSTMLVEMGAAIAWDKPTYVLLADATISAPEFPVSHFEIFARSSLDELVARIKQGNEQLTKNDIQHLTSLYSATGTSVDQLVLKPSSLSQLTQHFRQETGKAVSAERLRAELMRLRKQGQLPKVSPKPGRVAPATGQYAIIGPDGKKRKQVVVRKGQQLPPTQGKDWVYTRAKRKKTRRKSRR